MGILSGLQSDPQGTIIYLLYRIPAILIALTLHELAHGYVALRCGDPTAQMMGRLSFNPLRHLDPIGTVFMLLFGFGWAKPVPVNPRNFRKFRRDDLLVSIAGVVMNFCLFLLSMILIVAVNELMWKPELWTLLRSRKYFISLYEYMYSDATHDSVPVVEYFSSYLRVPWLAYVLTFLKTFTLLNLGLALFNLLPIPPLDGYHVVNDIFLRGKLHLSARVVQYISLGLMAFIFIPRFTGLPDYFSLGIGTAIEFIYENVQKAILAVAGLG